MRILVVEDSNRLRESIVLALRRSGYAVDATGDGREGLEMAEDHQESLQAAPPAVQVVQ